MSKLFLTPDSLENSITPEEHSQPTGKQRLNCLVCNHRIDPGNEAMFVTFPCNVRSFKDEAFKVWRCPDCKTIHCLEVVELTPYYAQYPFARGMLTLPLSLCYKNLHRRLAKHGFSKLHSLLDYGCGSGLFVQYLRQQGFVNCYGYDPYAPQDGFGNPAILKQGPFNYILLQDVIEHVEDPRALLNKLDTLLTATGYLLIGTPNAATIDLTQPNLSDYYNAVHVPYHLHLYTRKSLEFFGHCQGWKIVEFCDRPYHDTGWFGVNSRAWNEYQRLFDGTIDVVFEPINLWKALTSYRFLFYALFGYWRSFRTEMSIMFHKTGVSTNGT
jgi:2-polyprenyl-3-methyl-5-hydroxy-6-metoxy-1,4-benzoquinol methylase